MMPAMMMSNTALGGTELKKKKKHMEKVRETQGTQRSSSGSQRKRTWRSGQEASQPYKSPLFYVVLS